MAERVYHLLCIDDDVQSLKVRKLLLESHGFRVHTAGSGPEGLRAVRTLDPDAVIVDYQMPGMDGGEVARETKKWDPTLPLLILSGLPWLPDNAPQDCIDAFVSKAEPMATLVKKVRDIIPQRRHGDGSPGGRWPLRAARLAIGAAGVFAGAMAGLVQHKVQRHPKLPSPSATA